MKNIRSILVPTDFSKSAGNAIEHAIALAARFGARLTLLHAQTLFHNDSQRDLVQLKEEEAELRSSLRRVESLIGRKIESDTRIVRDIGAAAAILTYLSESETDLVVMGTHGRSGLAHVVLGSVAEQVSREANCPVLTIRAGQETDGLYDNIVVGFDFSEHSREALREAALLYETFGSRVHILHVFEQPIHPAYYPVWEPTMANLRREVEEDAEKTVGEACREVGLENWDLHIKTAMTSASRQIADFAETSNADLIVLGTHGLSGLDRLLLGSTSERVMRIAPCPVLTVRLPEIPETVDEERSTREEAVDLPT